MDPDAPSADGGRAALEQARPLDVQRANPASPNRAGGWSWWWVLLVCTAIATAAYVRLAHPDLSWFTYDQARDARAALGIVSGRSLPLLGVEVEGGPAHTWSPAYFYLIALLFAIANDPAFAVVALSATSVAAIALTERLGRAFFGRADCCPRSWPRRIRSRSSRQGRFRTPHCSPP